MPYDPVRTAKYAAAAAVVSYFGASAIDSVITAGSPYLTFDDKTKPVAVAVATVVAVDVAMQMLSP